MPRAAARSRRFACAASPPRSLGDPVVVERVGGGDRLLVAAPALDPLGGSRPLPQADQPQPGDAAPGQRVQLLVGDRVERPDLAAVSSRELVEPDVGALGDQHEARHPLAVGARSARARASAPANDGASAPPPPPPPPNRRWSARSSSASRSSPASEPRRQVRRAGSTAHRSRAYRSWPASEVGEWRAGRAEQSTSDSPSPSASPSPEAARRSPRSRRRRHLAAATGPGSTSGRSGSAGRILGGDVEQEQRLEQVRVAPAPARTPLRAGQDVVDRLPADGRRRARAARPRRRPGGRRARTVVDQGVADLVEQAEGHDLAGVGGRRSAARPGR